ncbi:MAG: 3-coathanger stack domain-containing protein, partial [Emticicia sp.]
SISCNIKTNDLPKVAFNDLTFDIDINLAGIQKSVTTTNGTFSIDNTGLIWFKPKLNFLGTDSLSYTYQNSAKYVSNTAKLKLTVYKCVTLLNLSSPSNDITNGVFQYNNNESVTLTNKINPTGSNMVTVKVNAANSILFLPGFTVSPSNGSTFEAKLNGCN